ncbi:hypothetical protein H6CHR_00055 [Variovorax sp. PBL-H6]|uniref:hypothetical protein n=1 Tax=Variovorax sp. PBL-H6 TaxID=434009 RepID=UPI0013170899|nr:hypothetical protein [Variovorax sp. PBL-H6]VTU14909.1 hypothetical protein H6CHR_00055 [Variovorax sp. PBL-H6]
MQPILDIRSVRPDLYTYSLGAAPAAELQCGDFFDTAERCLLDAGQGLYLYFDRVQIRFAGFSLGSYPVARMVEDPMGLFQELVACVLRVYRASAAPRRAPAQAARERLSTA